MTNKHPSLPPMTPTPRGDGSFYVYTNAYPEGFVSDDGMDLSGVVFYVGKGTWYAHVQRVDWHERDALRCWVAGEIPPTFNASKIRTIWQIWQSGKSVVKNIIFETSDEQEAWNTETVAIRQHASPYLTNLMRPRDVRHITTKEPVCVEPVRKQEKGDEEAITLEDLGESAVWLRELGCVTPEEAADMIGISLDDFCRWRHLLPDEFPSLGPLYTPDRIADLTKILVRRGLISGGDYEWTQNAHRSIWRALHRGPANAN